MVNFPKFNNTIQDTHKSNMTLEFLSLKQNTYVDDTKIAYFKILDIKNFDLFKEKFKDNENETFPWFESNTGDYMLKCKENKLKVHDRVKGKKYDAKIVLKHYNMVSIGVIILKK